MKKLLLTLFASPALFASIVPVLVMANHANAAELTITGPINRQHACVHNPHGTNLVCVRVIKTANAASPTSTVNSQQPPNNTDKMLAFSDEESDAAIHLFGCDCPACVNALRSLRGLQPVS